MNDFAEQLMPGISVVVPVYNSQDTLRDLVARLEPVLRAAVPLFEIIFVNDCSRDRSWEVIQELSSSFVWVRGFGMLRNFGQHSALLCGIRAARYDTLVTMDDDLQNPPEEISKLLSKLAEGFDMVYGYPEHEQHGLLRNLASRVTKLALQSAMGARTARHVSAFRAFRTKLRAAFADYRSPYVSIDVLLTWGTSRFTHIPVAHHPRTIGRSGYTVKKLIVHALNMMTGFSTAPLQLASLVGFAFTLFGIGILIYVMVIYLIHGRSVPGFTFLASIIAIFSGVQLFSLGLIGEYLARMHFRMMERPTYVVGETTEDSKVTPR